MKDEPRVMHIGWRDRDPRRHATKEAKALGDLLADMALMLDAQIEHMDHGQISDATLKALQECKEKMRL